MTDKNAAFVGSVPENYDRYLGPMLFEPYANKFGDNPVASTMQALVFEGRR